MPSHLERRCAAIATFLSAAGSHLERRCAAIATARPTSLVTAPTCRILKGDALPLLPRAIGKQSLGSLRRILKGDALPLLRGRRGEDPGRIHVAS